MSAITCALLITLVIVLAITKRASSERSVLYASIAIALSALISMEQNYDHVDGLLGSTDLAFLLSSVLTMVGLFFFARAVTRVGMLGTWLARVVLSLPTLLVAVAVAVVAFLTIDRHRGGQAEMFMATYGNQPSTAVYSVVMPLYLGTVMGAMELTTRRQVRVAGSPMETTLAWLLRIGSWGGLMLATNTLILTAAHLAGWNRVAFVFTVLSYPAQIVMLVFLIAGLTLAPIIRWGRARRRQRTLRKHLARVERLWREAADIQTSPTSVVELVSGNDEDRLHRRIVEIRDAAFSSGNDFTLTDEDRQLLSEVERHLIAGTA